ncbi:MAG: N-acetyl-gamma-glutamyl-phosphate reductase [Spirochaeta sp. LUC14_002_19_P3]|nr:MAG: N-acetyl-gamma-glutamyl-phosphate reductase [Spirochaeta sp. LUC14_002_19_P3]
MKAAVLGARGYTGRVLLRLLLNHPEVEQILPVSATAAGSKIRESDPGLGLRTAAKFPKGECFLRREEVLELKPDAVFSALPHGESASFCEPFFGKSILFDLSTDFRLSDAQSHLNAYGTPPPFPERRRQAAYGLAEIYRENIAKADIIAVPGCYPTCSLLPLLPIARAGLVRGPVIINALSGISGAGRTPKTETLYVERSESAAPYSPGQSHRHVPEIRAHLEAAGCHEALCFTPHLVPMRRGMLASISVPIHNSGLNDKDIKVIFSRAYDECPFIDIAPQRLPDTRDAVGSNRCVISWHITDAILLLFSAIDNLFKGASGQAVQAFNIRFGFPETTGLPLSAEA